MFEKEAEEYREKEKDEGYYWVTQEMEQSELDTIVDESFKDGAEFGYNKAKEEDKWHRADVPTEPINKIVLGYIKNYNSKKFCLVSWNGEWWYDANTYNDKVKLIAWKEIVLPKEIKEND